MAMLYSKFMADDSAPTSAPQVTFGDLNEASSSSAQTSQPSPVEPVVDASSSSQQANPPAQETSPVPSPVSFSDILKEEVKDVIGKIIETPSAPQQSVPLASPEKNSVDLQKIREIGLSRRIAKKNKHLDQIILLAKNSSSISNSAVRRLLHVSQSTATNYLHELVSRGMLKSHGTRGGAKYTI